MSLSIGIDCSAAHWKTCLREHGQNLHVCSFVDFTAALPYLEGVCALFPEPTIALPFGRGTTSLSRLSALTDQQLHAITSPLNKQQPQADLQQILIAIKALSLDSYCLPSIKHLPSVPMHRKLNPIDLGTPDSLCIVATLMYRLCERQTAWSEMNFLCVVVGYNSKSIVVVENGHIVNGIDQDHLSDPGYAEATAKSFVDDTGTRRATKEAFWEELIRDLAGLMAIHHLEDIIVLGKYKDAFVERFADTYQVYFFPHGEPGTEGYEIAIGAAIIAEGLRHPGLAAEVVQRLQIH